MFKVQSTDVFLPDFNILSPAVESIFCEQLQTGGVDVHCNNGSFCIHHARHHNAFGSWCCTEIVDSFSGLRIHDCRSESRCNILNQARSEEHTSELQSRGHLVCRLLLEKKNND